MDEQSAIEHLKHGDIGGLEILVRLHQVRALRAAFLITQDYPLAEDIVQSAFVRAFERIHQFDETRPFGPWFLRSVVNDARKTATRRGRLSSLDRLTSQFGDLIPGFVRPEGPDADAILRLERAETREEIEMALKQLTLEQRTAVVARYYLQMSEAETAEAMGRARGTVKWYLHHARRRLKALLDPL